MTDPDEPTPYEIAETDELIDDIASGKVGIHDPDPAAARLAAWKAEEDEKRGKR